MAKPPLTPPHSDLDGVHQDEKSNTDAAQAAGEDAGDLDRARREAAARPGRSGEAGADDRSR